MISTGIQLLLNKPLKERRILNAIEKKWFDTQRNFNKEKQNISVHMGITPQKGIRVHETIDASESCGFRINNNKNCRITH